jgi:hypothetical protein
LQKEGDLDLIILLADLVVLEEEVDIEVIHLEEFVFQIKGVQEVVLKKAEVVLEEEEVVVLHKQVKELLTGE